MKSGDRRYTLVLDTSVIAKWFLPEPLSEVADGILEEVRRGRVQPASPDLIVYELANILWQRQKRQEISSRQALAIMSDFEHLPIRLVPADALGSEALKIAAKTGCTAYDAAFLTLAAGLGCPLVTADQRFVRLMAGTRFKKQIVWLGHWETPRSL